MSPEAPAAPPGPPGVREAVEAWQVYEATRWPVPAVPLRRLRGTARAATQHWGDRPVTTLDRGQYRAFFEAYGARCRADHAGTPCSTLAQPPAACPSYERTLDSQVDHAVEHLKRFERFLVEQGYIPHDRLTNYTWCPITEDDDEEDRVEDTAARQARLAQRVVALTWSLERDQRRLMRYRSILAERGVQP